LGQVRRGAVGNVRLLGGHEVEGTISYIGAVADDRTRTFPVEVEVPNSDRSMIENVTAEIRIPMPEVPAHKIEASLLSLSDDGTLGVKSVDADGLVDFHPVDILGDEDGGIWVGGLPETLTLITVGQEFVVAGQRVEAIDEADIASRAVQ
jgi:membrane fusion protein, multidrug efflux system